MFCFSLTRPNIDPLALMRNNFKFYDRLALSEERHHNARNTPTAWQFALNVYLHPPIDKKKKTCNVCTLIVQF